MSTTQDLFYAVQDIQRLTAQLEQPPLTLAHLTRLADFQCHADAALFVAIFGHAIGPHLWHKFQAYDENLLFIYNQMDNRTAQKLLDYLNSQPAASH